VNDNSPYFEKDVDSAYISNTFISACDPPIKALPEHNPE
jgi:hypothetical protein